MDLAPTLDTSPSDDDRFFAAFDRCTLPPADFHHREHVRAGWLYLRRYGLLPGVARFTAALRRFAAYAGVPGIYHETVTCGYLLLIHERMRPRTEDGAESWAEFAARSPELFAWKPSLLDDLYLPETLWSEEARRRFVLPDRAP